MKKGYRMAACLLIVCMLLSLSGCIIIPFHHSGLMLYGRSPVASVTLYDLRDDYLRGGDKEHDFEQLEENHTPIAELPASEWASCCVDLTLLRFTLGLIVFPPVAQDPNFDLWGYLICVTYENGDRELVSPHCCANRKDGAWYTEKGFCDEDVWNALLQKYFPDSLS